MLNPENITDENDVRQFWKTLLNYCELNNAPFYFQMKGNDRTYLGYRVKTTDAHYVDVYAVDVNSASADPCHFYYKYEKTTITTQMKDWHGRTIFLVDEEPRLTSLELMGSYDILTELQTTPRVLVDDTEYFVLEMKEVARNGYTEVTMTLLNKYNGFRKTHYTSPKHLWAKSDTDRNLYVDTKETL